MLENSRFGNIGNWQTSLTDTHKLPGHDSTSLYFYEWAERPVILSEGYFTENLPESSKFEDGPQLIHEAMRTLDSLFLHELGDANHDYLSEKGFRCHFLDKIKDPGLLHHYIFWDLVKDPTAMTFEWHHFRGHSHLCREMLDGQNYDIFGRPCLANTVRGPWEHLIELYHAEINSPRDNGYARKLFGEVLGWPLS